VLGTPLIKEALPFQMSRDAAIETAGKAPVLKSYRALDRLDGNLVDALLCLYILSRALVIDTKQTTNFSLRFDFGNAGKDNWLTVGKLSN